jgi:membrane protein
VIAPLVARIQAWSDRAYAAATRWWLAAARRSYTAAVVGRAIWRFGEREGGLHAAAISYYVFFSLFPLLIFVGAMFGLVVRDVTIRERAAREIIRQLPPGVNLDREVHAALTNVAEMNNGLVGALALLGTLWTASGMFGALRQSLNVALGVHAGRNVIHAKLVDLGSVLLVMGLLVLSTLTSTGLAYARARALGLLEELPFDTGPGWGLLYYVFPFLISYITFTVMYRIVPDRRPKFDDVLVGALIAALGFELAKLGFGFYLTHFAQYQRVYGALGGVVAFMAFVYIVAAVIILAGHVIAELERDPRPRRQPRARAAASVAGPAVAPAGQRDVAEEAAAGPR